jgi:2'-5' RNA ligase
LFTALWPSAEAVHALHTELAGDQEWPPEGWRPVPTSRWHVTLSVHGDIGKGDLEKDAEEGVLARRLEARAEGLAAPWLRLAGSVPLPRVVTAGVLCSPLDPADPIAAPLGPALAALTEAAGADPSRFLPHVTVARTSRRDDRPPVGATPARHRGPWWCPEEVCLVLSESTSAGPRYSVLHRVPLRAAASAPPRAVPIQPVPRLERPRIEYPRGERRRGRPPSSGPVARPA